MLTSNFTINKTNNSQSRKYHTKLIFQSQGKNALLEKDPAAIAPIILQDPVAMVHRDLKFRLGRLSNSNPERVGPC